MASNIEKCTKMCRQHKIRSKQLEFGHFN